MVSSGIQRGFYFIWIIIKLNMFFLLFSLMGGILLGIGPSFQTMVDLLSEYGLDYQNMTLSNYYINWKYNFRRSNLHFFIMEMLTILVVYNLFLSTQMKGLVWFIADIIMVFILLLIMVMYLYLVQYESKYDISTINLFKLSFISVFFNFFGFLKIILGIITIIFITWNFKGLLLFATFALIAIWSEFSTKEKREIISRKLEENEEAYKANF
ncbi:DUF624 domain-containing protein [Enterococcus cecorum]|uniref:YesL family protein n=1 Tax=Enterococcus cecorum TaxID=44008 RepID=UPI002ACA7732|nr:DUF624 domain-containing protein [Enterococcus cecorum]MDZ5560578.1 DUF624 domain-containing protein [Enterococcus cecorum]